MLELWIRLDGVSFLNALAISIVFLFFGALFILPVYLRLGAYFRRD